jgi:hypothetical protein
MKLLRGSQAHRSRVPDPGPIKRQVVYAGGDCFYLLTDPKDDVRIGDLVRWTSPRRVRYAFCVAEQTEIPGRWRLAEFS